MENMTNLQLDHLAVACACLEEGVAWVEERLGLPMGPGGQHVTMGTHNRLMAMGDIYLEVIAPDPDGGPVGWFGLWDPPATPQLVHWLCRAPRVEGVEVTRGDLRWTLTVPEGGGLPMAGAEPSLIQWIGGGHPLDRLPPTSARLRQLTVRHPDARQAWACDPRVRVEQAPLALIAEIETPGGLRIL